MRAQSDAIMIGIGTALADDPMLTCRLPGMAEYSPVRVVLDSTLRLPLGSRLVKTARRSAGLGDRRRSTRRRAAEDALLARGVEVLRSPQSADGRLDLAGRARAARREAASPG